ncbi:TetR/AcrR family transcriptional regulator [Novosphingopyxis iocasae]|uniref:TetR/AcrR family transcriptional regulator n=1 Tax=Novosphingopyxis iocasae TaxID=2762729 RepID=UPI0016511262|nr:TetR/AcrR family transcriptional regulator [Novosphingopyxis iocasae]
MTKQSPPDKRAASAGDGSIKPRQRRSQAERREESRRRAVDAAIHCLAEEGYAATTMIHVAELAKISRGGLLHHFPGKPELLEAVARESIRRLTAKRKAALGNAKEGVDRFIALTDAAWANIREPESIAIMEIMIGSRSDPQITDLSRTLAKLDRFQAVKAKKLARRAGITSDKLIDTMNRLHQAAMRGLVLEWVITGNEDHAEEAFDLLSWYKIKVTERMLEESSHLTSV